VTLEAKREYNRKWAREHPEKMRESARKYRLANRDKCNESTRRWKSRRDPRITAAVQKRWKERNPGYYNNYQKERRKRDPNFRIRCTLSDRVRRVVSRNLKSGSSVMLLGCSLADFRIYLESKFDVGMSWDNYGHKKGQWNIDHIIPCALFDLTKPEHQKRCFHFSNLQPMWATDNYRKKIKTDNQFRLI